MPKYIPGADQILVEKITIGDDEETSTGKILIATHNTVYEKGTGVQSTKTNRDAHWYKIIDWGHEIEAKVKDLNSRGIEYLKKGHRVVIKQGWEGSPFYATLYTKGRDTKQYEVIEERMISMILDYSEEFAQKAITVQPVDTELSLLYNG